MAALRCRLSRKLSLWVNCSVKPRAKKTRTNNYKEAVFIFSFLIVHPWATKLWFRNFQQLWVFGQMLSCTWLKVVRKATAIRYIRCNIENPFSQASRRQLHQRWGSEHYFYSSEYMAVMLASRGCKKF